MDLEDHYARINGVRLHYVQSGSQAGHPPLVIFLHGFPEFWYAWAAQLREFGRNYLAVAPDMRGYNLSEKPAGIESYRMRNLIEDVRQLASRLGYSKFVLAGHDWGGAVAWAYAIGHPETLEKLVIVNAPHPGIFARELAHNPAQRKASEYMTFFQQPEAPEQALSAGNYAALVSIVMGDGLRTGAFTEEDRQAYLAAWSQPGALTGGLNYYRAAGVGPHSSGNFAPDPARLIVNVPTLVIWGEKDTALLPGNLDGLNEFVPRLTIQRIPDGSHWVIHEKPAEVNRLIREFLVN